MAGSFLDVIHLIADGAAVDAAHTNQPLLDLQNNCVYLKQLLLASVGSQALYNRAAPLNPAALVGQPVYFNTAAGYYDLAVADGSAAENLVGLVASKASPGVGDVITLGYAPLSLANALPGGTLLPPAPGRYFLSTTVPGRLVTTQPAVSVLACIADGLGDVFVLPQIRDARGAQGFTGSPGPVGSPGPAGTAPAQPQAVSAAGTSADGYATLTTQAGGNGLAGVLTLKNLAGANGLAWQLTVTDAFGDTNVVGTGTLAGNASVAWALTGVLVAGTLPPYTSVALAVKSQAPGSPAGYALKGAVLK